MLGSRKQLRDAAPFPISDLPEESTSTLNYFVKTYFAYSLPPMIEKFAVIASQWYPVRSPEAHMMHFYFVLEHCSGFGRPEWRL